MDLIETLKLDEDEMYKAVEKDLEKEFPEEMKLVDELSADQWEKVWLLAGSAIKKGFEMGFTLGQQRRA